MSLLRDRAIEARVESTCRARRPAEARAWFVRLTSCRSDVELNVFGDQASVVEGSDSTPIEVAAKASDDEHGEAPRVATEELRRTAGRGRTGGNGEHRQGGLVRTPVGDAGTNRPYGPRPATSAGRWSCARRARVPRGPPHHHGPCRTARDPPGPHRTGQLEAAPPPDAGRGRAPRQPPIVEANAA